MKAVFTSILLSLFLFIPKVKAQTTPPNILLIIADDVGVDVFNGYHQLSIPLTTPTLDSLRGAGITFNNAWSAPVCTSTRGTIMSGKHGVKTGVLKAPSHLDTAHISIFRELSKQTNNLYKGAVVGKWHISAPANANHPIDHGLDYYMGVLEAQVNAYNNWDKTENGVTTTDTNYVTSVLTDKAATWINNQTQPWFMWLAHVAPHAPFHEPPAHMHTINATTNFRKYIAMLESLDYEINRLFNAIPDSVLANTVILFIGDNGTPGSFLQDYPAGHAKGTIYQGGIRIPMIVSGAGVTRQNERENNLVHVNDIYATVLEIAGTNLPGGIYNSLSFKHLLDGNSGAKKDYNYSEIASADVDGWTIRNEQYKLNEYADGGQEFFDLFTDSLEFNDLLLGTLTTAEQAVKTDLEIEAAQTRSAWSCRDHIQNGDETGIDCGGSFCSPCSGIGFEHQLVNRDLYIYPNPTQHLLNIQRDEALSDHPIQYIISNAVGEVLKSGHIPSGINHVELDLSNLKPQLLLVHLIHEDSPMYLPKTYKLLKLP